MAEPEPANCRRCDKAVLAGTVEELYVMQLSIVPVPHSDALVLHRYKVPLVDLLIRQVGGKPYVTSSRMFWPSPEPQEDWTTLQPHGCETELLRWGLL